jgi:hypothetical protein
LSRSLRALPSRLGRNGACRQPCLDAADRLPGKIVGQDIVLGLS